MVVIAVTVSSILQNCEVWKAFGHGNKLRYIPCHRIANKLGTGAFCRLLFFHAVSGCDTDSAFRGVGKEKARAIWRSMSHLDHNYFRSVITCTKANIHRRFKAVGKSCCSPVLAHIPLSRVNDVRKQIFTQNRRIDNILPTLNVLEQNVKRAADQAGHIWGQSLIRTPELPPTHMWAW